MIPVLTPAQMTEVDRSAVESSEVLIRRAAGHVARVAVSMMGGTYGRSVLVVAGPGNNGEDGRVAARLLSRQGVRVTVVDAIEAVDSTQSEAAAGTAAGRGMDSLGRDSLRSDLGRQPILGIASIWFWTWRSGPDSEDPSISPTSGPCRCWRLTWSLGVSGLNGRVSREDRPRLSGPSPSPRHSSRATCSWTEPS